MIKRYMLLGYYTNKDYQMKNINNASVAFYDDKVFLYFETDNNADYKKIADEIIDIDLYTLPNGEKWIEMIDIFHYSYPYNDIYWRRKEENKKAVFKIAYLKPENVGEYIFYHYKAQREADCGFDKYGAIYIYQNMLIMYMEEPRETADLSLVENKWEKLIPDYNGNIIGDMSVCFDDGTNGWKNI